MKLFKFTNTIKNQIKRSKKLILLLITITTFTNLGYASFPVTDDIQTEINEGTTIQNPELSRNNNSRIYAVLSVLLLLLGLISLFVMYIGMITFSIGGPAIANLIAVSIYSFLASIVLGIIAIVKK